MAAPTGNERRIERIVKGFANHRRIQIMRLLQREPELPVLDVAKRLRINFKTASEHIRRLALAGLVLKRHEGRWVRHRLTGRAVKILRFLQVLE